MGENGAQAGTSVSPFQDQATQYTLQGEDKGAERKLLKVRQANYVSRDKAQLGELHPILCSF